ncbi:AI-2E family transporter [Roseococcus sp. SYP-B2431]|uniref:AI-2E family transporter n=1 Tax=Roseococcus sp. SYP-B2431 TaxID=2496640 RepID=UPI001039D05B|nr:AI-2E family transporter [Roseococcus sp. SYP-B2431]TCH99664.1 AI-2E family transporter [Roseococcus sp. SYP-B2431]
MSRTLLSALILLATLLVLFILTPGVLLVLFAGALLAVALRALAVPIAARLGVGEGWGVAAVALLALVLAGLAFWFAADALSAQADSFRQELPGLVQGVQERLSRYGWGRWIIEQVDPRRLMPSGETAGQVANYAVTSLGGLLGGLGDAVLILLLGLYLASDPATYRKAALCLVAPPARPRFRALLDEAGETLRGWLLGQLFAMAVTGLITGLGLWALGVPLAGLLALIAAIFGFIPYIGPVISVVPALLVALGEDPSLIPWVIGLFVLSQNVEGNLLTPMVQSRTADMPPAYLLGAQALMGSGFGLIGVVLAAPLAAVVMVAVKVGYVEGWVEAPAEPSAGQVTAEGV